MVQCELKYYYENYEKGKLVCVWGKKVRAKKKGS